MRPIVLTPSLVKLRIQARKVFPKAEWLPGDECPVGLRVLRGSDGHPAIVLGEAKRQEGDPTEWWWELRDDRFPEHVVLDWPPSLRRAG